MKKFAISIATFLFSLNAFSQKDISKYYFPKEKLSLESCKNSEDSDRCIYDFIQSKVEEIIKSHYQAKNLKGDTLKIQVGFEVTKKGKIDDYLLTRIHSFKENKSLNALRNIVNKDLRQMLKKLPQFQLANAKPSKISSVHYFLFYYVNDTNGKKNNLKFLKPKANYNGGDIVENPKSEDCVDKTTIQDLQNCNIKYVANFIRNRYVATNFAEASEFKGRLRVRFKIDKKGNVINVQTKGEQKEIFRNEMKRIIGTMPKFLPMKISGKPKIKSYYVTVVF